MPLGDAIEATDVKMQSMSPPRGLYRNASTDDSARRCPPVPAPSVLKAGRGVKVTLSPNPSPDPTTQAILRNFLMGKCRKKN